MRSGDLRSYGSLTEAPGGMVTREGAAMLRSRYEFAAAHADSRRVLEIGCGPGVGLGLIQARATYIIGGDYDGALLRVARRIYRSRVPLVCMDAERLPFADGSFDLVLFFEGTYYVPDMDAVFDEVSRVLGSAGQLLLVNANPERPDFIRSPKSVHYHTVSEFCTALEARGFEVRAEGAFPVERRGIRAWVLKNVRRAAASLGLVPRTLSGRAALKRIFFGRLTPVPEEIGAEFCAVAPREEVSRGVPVTDFKVVYLTAWRPRGRRTGLDD